MEMFRFKQKRLADLGTRDMEVVAGISQGFAALADIMIVGALSMVLHPSRNPRMKACVLRHRTRILDIDFIRFASI
jgi:hypothetical protein